VDRRTASRRFVGKEGPGIRKERLIQGGIAVSQFERGADFSLAGIESAQQLYDLIEQARALPGLISEQTQATGVSGDFILMLQVASGLLRKMTLESVILPPGIEVPFGGSVAPGGWLFANGQAVNRTGYAALFTIYGVTFGGGDGSTTFNLPDYRGRTAFGKDDMGGTAAQNRITTAGSGINGIELGAAGGLEKTILSENQIPTGTANLLGSPHLMKQGGANPPATPASVPNMPPGIIRNWIIKT
jgi:microcystin-dependent protein